MGVSTLAHDASQSDRRIGGVRLVSDQPAPGPQQATNCFERGIEVVEVMEYADHQADVEPLRGPEVPEVGRFEIDAGTHVVRAGVGDQFVRIVDAEVASEPIAQVRDRESGSAPNLDERDVPGDGHGRQRLLQAEVALRRGMCPTGPSRIGTRDAVEEVAIAFFLLGEFRHRST